MNLPPEDQPLFDSFDPAPKAPDAEAKPAPRPGEGVQVRAKQSPAPAHFSADQWDDWQWQVRNRITTSQELEKWITLSVEEKRAIHFSQGRSFFSLTPYWVSLMDPEDMNCPIRRQAVPLDEEFRTAVHDSDDGFEGVRAVSGRLSHLYPDRAILSVHAQCIVYCRFCPQKRVSDKPKAAPTVSHEFPALTEADWKETIHYLTGHPQIREVILSGGEPLLLRDELLQKAFDRLREVPSIRSLRLETRIVSFLPQRVTPELVKILRQAQPLYLVLHVNHPREITPEFAEAAGRLADAGIPLVSQTVLLREINDKAQTLSELFSQLYKLRIRPYRLMQCVPSKGADHFRTNISLGLRLIESLRGRMAGLSLPEYVVDTAGGKIPLRYESILSRNRKRVMLKNHEGKIFVYPEKSFSF